MHFVARRSLIFLESYYLLRDRLSIQYLSILFIRNLKSINCYISSGIGPKDHTSFPSLKYIAQDVSHLEDTTN